MEEDNLYEKIKKIGSLVLASFLALSLTACGTAQSANTSNQGQTNSAQKIKIGFASTNLSNEFQVYMRQAAEAKAKELGVDFIGADGQGDAAKQVSQIESFIAQKVNAIVLAPTDANADAPAVEKAVAAKIPIIIVNSTVSNMDKANSYVGSNDSDAGQMEMQHIADLLNGKGNVVVLQGPIGNSAEVGRTAGINEILKKYSNIKIVAEQPGNWDRAQGMTIMENWLQSGQKIDAVVAENDEMALGAYNAIAAAGKQNAIKVIGVDAIPDALKAVQAGKMAATVFQDAKGQGSQAIEVAVNAAKGQSIQKQYLIPFQLVTKDNVSKFINN